jgi:ribosomal protein S18 acetylase RimI-like enzyme
VLHYRRFRNTDPPALVEVWNQAFTGRGALRLRSATPLERFTFAKLHFDPAGLIVAEDDGVVVGFVHAGFGASEDQSALSPAAGVTCALGVRPEYRRKGIGAELLRRSEAYLRERGAQTLHAGPLQPLNPFYHGVYGGSDLPGFLTSEAEAAPFLLRQGYRPRRTVLVFQRRLNQTLKLADGRFPALRQRYELRVGNRKRLGSWWKECVLGTLEPLDFALEEKLTGALVARAFVWEMEGFSWRWNQTAAGILDLEVRDDLRRRGLGKFLVSQILRYLQEQFFELAEIQALETDEPALRLVRGLGFEEVDQGHSYQKES